MRISAIVLTICLMAASVAFADEKEEAQLTVTIYQQAVGRLQMEIRAAQAELTITQGELQKAMAKQAEIQKKEAAAKGPEKP